MSPLSLLLVLASAQSQAVLPPAATDASEAEIAAKSYMKDTGVSLETAKRRIQIESELPPFIEDLKERYRDRLTFVSVESLPDQHLVVGLKGNGMEPAQRINVSGSAIRVEFEEGYPYTAQEFHAVMKKAIPRVVELIPDATSVDGRPELGLIEVWVRGTDEQAYQRAVVEIQKLTGLKVKLVLGKSLSRNSAYTAGGAILSANGRMCTSGLAVRNRVTQEKGLITAAHCDDQLMYSNYGQTAGGPQVLMPLTFKNGLFDASHDVQWHTLPGGNTPLQEVFAESTHEYQTKALLTIWAGPPLNGRVCFRGARTGFSCGTVTSINHTPLGTCGAVLCDPIWARVEGQDLACASGDSGAAVFYIGSGYGIVKSTLNPSDSILKGACEILTVMPFGQVADLDLQPL